MSTLAETQIWESRIFRDHYDPSNHDGNKATFTTGRRTAIHCELTYVQRRHSTRVGLDMDTNDGRGILNVN